MPPKSGRSLPRSYAHPVSGTVPPTVLTPDTVILGYQPVVEDIEKVLHRLMTLTPLRDVINILGRQRRRDAIQPHKGGSDRGRRIRVIIRINLNALKLTCRKAHSGIRTQTHRVIADAPAAAEWWILRMRLFQPLQKAVKMGVRQAFAERVI